MSRLTSKRWLQQPLYHLYSIRTLLLRAQPWQVIWLWMGLIHTRCGADHEGFTTTEAGAGTNMLGVVGMDGREEALVTPVKLVSVQAQGPSRRSSARRVGRSLDKHSLVRAQLLTTKRNLDPQGTCSGSFLCLSDNHTINNITNLGVFMGNNDYNSVVKKVTREIREFEHGRIANSPISNIKVK